MTRPRKSTKERILQTSLKLMKKGAHDVTLDEVAKALGLTRQAVLYHFNSKDRLLWEIGLLGVEAESEVATKAVAGARNARDALARFLRALFGHYRDNIEMFRAIYLGPQLTNAAWLNEADRQERLYPATSRMYDALEAALKADPKWPKRKDARRLAVAAHMAALGFATIEGVVQWSKEPYARDVDDYVEALIAALAPLPR